MTEAGTATALGLAAALGAGLLIGLERERRKRSRRGAAQAQAAGIRSFALVALAGGLAQVLGQALAQPLLVLLGAAMVALLAVVAYARSLRLPGTPVAEIDPGLTTELALFVPYLAGVLAAGEAMVRIERRVEPACHDPDRWEDAYRRFRRRCTGHEERP